jgi:hypothetical protein
MAIGTFSELKTAIATWVVRSDLTSRIGDFVALTEAEIRKDVRCQAMEELASGTLSGNTLDFPTGFIWAKRFKVDRYIHEYVTPADFSDLDEQDSTSPRFTIIGQKLYVLDYSASKTYSLIYLKAFTALSADADTNWLLTNHPDVYLWGGCKQVALALKDDAEAARCDGLYRAAVARVNRSESMAAAGGSPLTQRSSSNIV